MKAKYVQSVCYLDTNLLIYMFDASDPARQQTANDLYLHCCALTLLKKP